MLKLNKTPKFFSSLALMAALTVSTAVYAMEPEEESPKVARSKTPDVIDQALMEEVRYIVQEKVLQNLWSSSKKHFATNEYIEYKSLDQAKPRMIDEVQHLRNIFWFNQNVLTQQGFAKTLNNDIISLLKFGKKPTYCEHADAFDGVAALLMRKGITLDILLGRKNTVKDLPKKGISQDSLSHEGTFANSSEESEASEEIATSLARENTFANSSESLESETSEEIAPTDSLKDKSHRRHKKTQHQRKRCTIS